MMVQGKKQEENEEDRKAERKWRCKVGRGEGGGGGLQDMKTLVPETSSGVSMNLWGNEEAEVIAREEEIEKEHRERKKRLKQTYK